MTAHVEPFQYSSGAAARLLVSLGRLVITCIVAGIFASCDQEIDSQAAVTHAPPTFHTSAQPTFVLSDDGRPETFFSGVSARKLPSGEVVVGDRGSLTVRIFGRDGGLQRTLTRSGNGPGELAGPFVLASDEDTIFTLGQPPGSPPDVHVFSATEGHLFSFRPTTDTMPVLTPLDRLSTGQLLVRRGTTARILATAPALGQLTPDSVRYGLLTPIDSRGGGNAVWLRPVVRQWFFAYRWPNGPLPTAMAPYRFGPMVLVVTSENRLWFLDGETGNVRAFDATGRQVVSTQLSLETQPFDGARLQESRVRALAAASSPLDSAKVEALFAETIRPQTMPLLSDARAGYDGEVWVRLFGVDERAPQRFLVLNRDGQEIAQSTLPAGLTVQQIGSDFVLAVHRNEMGVESVIEYELMRP